MLSYIKSEFYRLFREKNYWIFISVFSLLVLAAGIVLNLTDKVTPNFPYDNTRFLLINVMTSMGIPFLFLSVISQLIVEEDIKQNTLKNTVSFGISRSTIYFGKWIVSVIALLIVALITVTISIASAYLLLEDSGTVYLLDFLSSFLGIAPIMLAGLTTYHFLYFVSNSHNSVLMIYVGIYYLPYIIGRFLGGRYEIVGWIYRHTPIYLLGNTESVGRHIIMAGNTNSGRLTCWIVGGGITLIFLVVGKLQFKKMEIK